MLILTGVSLKYDLIQVYDTDDNTNERMSLSVLARKLRSKDLRIYGIREYNNGEFYPPDAHLVNQCGIVIIPSEAKTAMERAKLK